MVSLKWDVPVNFIVSAVTEEEADDFVKKMLNSAIYKRGLEDLIEFQNFEFVASESSCSGCGNHDHEQG